MYDVQTILSAYDKQGTLVQWLKNLDEVLKGSGLETIEKVEVENGVKLVFKFAGGTTIESPVINKINTLNIEADSVKLALTDTNGVLVEYYTTLTVNGENVESNIKILFPIKGSESVIVDVAENGTAIEIHLDSDILNDITRALKTPLTSPSATELVAVDTNGAQTMLEIGQGLRVSAGILEAEATGGGNYVLELTGESGTLTDEQYQAVVNNFPNAVVSLTDVGIILNASANMGDGFVFSLLQPNNEISLSGGIVIVNSDKSFQKMITAYTFPTSSGGLTKTKVTLAELQAMCTVENVGVLVNILPKNAAAFAFLSLCAPSVNILDLSYLESNLVGIILPINGILENDDSSFQAFNCSVAISSLGVIDMQTDIYLVSLNSISKDTSQTLSTLFNDENFNFYIYK